MGVCDRWPVIGTYNMGSTSTTSYPVYALSEETAVSSPQAFTQVEFYTALDVLRSGVVAARDIGHLVRGRLGNGWQCSGQSVGRRFDDSWWNHPSAFTGLYTLERSLAACQQHFHGPDVRALVSRNGFRFGVHGDGDGHLLRHYNHTHRDRIVQRLGDGHFQSFQLYLVRRRRFVLLRDDLHAR